MKMIVKFGRYSFDVNEQQEIEWLVLDETPDGKKLLLSKYCIEVMRYEYEDNQNKDPKWENCAVRNWLSNRFLNTSFTFGEKERMHPIMVETPNGAVLNDRIILMDEETVARYLPIEKDRRAKPTPWAKRPIHGEDPIHTERGYCGWLLRDPSLQFYGNYTFVRPNGSLNLAGGDFYLSPRQGIRPVILVSFE